MYDLNNIRLATGSLVGPQLIDHSCHNSTICKDVIDVTETRTQVITTTWISTETSNWLVSALKQKPGWCLYCYQYIQFIHLFVLWSGDGEQCWSSSATYGRHHRAGSDMPVRSYVPAVGSRGQQGCQYRGSKVGHRVRWWRAMQVGHGNPSQWLLTVDWTTSDVSCRAQGKIHSLQ